MDMDEAQLNEALEHDVARKATAATQVVAHPGVPVTAADVDDVEIKQAYLAKAVSVSYVDAAHACIRMALQEVAPVVDTTGDMAKAAKPKVDHKRVEMLMSLGERAVKIAKELDILGDKNLVRYQEAPDPDTTEQ